MSRTLHVAVVAPGFPATRDEPGMAALVDLIERIAAVHRVTVIALHHPSTRTPYRIAGARVVPLGLPSGRGWTGRTRVLIRAVAELIRQSRATQVDVVHALWADEPGAVAVLGAWAIRRRSVVSALGGEFVGLADIGYGAALGRGGRWATRLVASGAATLTVGSEYMAGQARRFGVRAAPLVAPLGVDTDLFAPPKREGLDAGTVLFVGSLEPVKDPLAMVRVFARVARERPRARLVVCGDGRLRTDVERAAAKLGLADRVSLHGQVSRAEMPGVYRAARVLCVTSRHEGQHVAAVEAAASGLPIVGYAVGALPDLEGGTRVVPAGDEEALASALALMLNDDALATRTGHAARTAALANYAIAATSERYLGLYRRMAPRA